MPCLNENHKQLSCHRAWPNGGESSLHIERCERRCGWCTHVTTTASNLRKHAQRHLEDEKDTVSGVRIEHGRAGRSKGSLRRETAVPKQDAVQVEQRIAAVHNSSECDSRLDHIEALTRSQQQFRHAYQAEHFDLAKRIQKSMEPHGVFFKVDMDIRGNITWTDPVFKILGGRSLVCCGKLYNSLSHFLDHVEAWHACPGALVSTKGIPGDEWRVNQTRMNVNAGLDLQSADELSSMSARFGTFFPDPPNPEMQ